MTVIDAKICSNCDEQVPKDCDGRLYRVEGWKRLVCLGSDGESFFKKDGELRFRIVMGHGCAYDVKPELVEG